jgi:ribosomal protein S8
MSDGNYQMVDALAGGCVYHLPEATTPKQKGPQMDRKRAMARILYLQGYIEAIEHITAKLNDEKLKLRTKQAELKEFVGETRDQQ